MSKVNLGDRAKDTVTGFVGIVTVRAEYISGCARVGLQPPVGDDGKVPEAQHFDEPMVEVLNAGFVKRVRTDDGGPQRTPPQHPAPTR